MELYVYRAYVERVIDGDTYLLIVDLGFNLQFRCRLRLHQVDTPELRGREKESGRISAEFVRDLIQCKYVTLKSLNKTDNFGRWIGAIILDDGTSLGEAIVEANMGEIMILSHREPWWKRLLKRIF